MVPNSPYLSGVLGAWMTFKKAKAKTPSTTNGWISPFPKELLLSRTCCLLNWFMSHLGRVTCTVHSIFASKEGIKCTKSKDYLRAYCLRICLETYFGLGNNFLTTIVFKLDHFVVFWGFVAVRTVQWPRKFPYGASIKDVRIFLAIFGTPLPHVGILTLIYLTFTF